MQAVLIAAMWIFIAIAVIAEVRRLRTKPKPYHWTDTYLQAVQQGTMSPNEVRNIIAGPDPYFDKIEEYRRDFE